MFITFTFSRRKSYTPRQVWCLSVCLWSYVLKSFPAMEISLCITLPDTADLSVQKCKFFRLWGLLFIRMLSQPPKTWSWCWLHWFRRENSARYVLFLSFASALSSGINDISLKEIALEKGFARLSSLLERHPDSFEERELVKSDSTLGDLTSAEDEERTPEAADTQEIGKQGSALCWLRFFIACESLI